MTDTGAAYDVEEQRIRINRPIAETETNVTERHEWLANVSKLDRDARFGAFILIHRRHDGGSGDIRCGGSLLQAPRH